MQYFFLKWILQNHSNHGWPWSAPHVHRIQRVTALMGKNATPKFSDPKTIATYLGETIGTHYSAALRAAEAYGKHLAASRDQLLQETFEGDGLRAFWVAMMKSEQLRSWSPGDLKRLGTAPTHYFYDFLDTADSVFERNYRDVAEAQRKKLGHTEHAQCLRVLRDHKAEGLENHFAVQNKVGQWMQMIRVMGRYQE